MQEAYDAGNTDECSRRRGVLRRFMQALDV
jgi:hypothetical protein